MFLKKKINTVFVILVTSFITSMILFAHDWMAPAEESAKSNPYLAGLDLVTLGKLTYRENCAYCHGKNAEGKDGKSLGLDMNPPDLIKRINSHTDGDFFWKIQTGRDLMPSFKGDLNEKEIWSIISYLRNLESN